jgi:hypothetical protein
MGDTTVYNKTIYGYFQNITPPSYCKGTCTNYTLQTIEHNPVFFNLSSTFDSFNLTNYYDLTTNETTKKVYFVAQRPLSSRSNCPYIYEAFTMKFANVQMILPQLIQNINYNPPSRVESDPITGLTSTVYYTNYREVYSIPAITINKIEYSNDDRV